MEHSLATEVVSQGLGCLADYARAYGADKEVERVLRRLPQALDALSIPAPAALQHYSQPLAEGATAREEWHPVRIHGVARVLAACPRPRWRLPVSARSYTAHLYQSLTQRSPFPVPRPLACESGGWISVQPLDPAKALRWESAGTRDLHSFSSFKALITWSATQDGTLPSGAMLADDREDGVLPVRENLYRMVLSTIVRTNVRGMPSSLQFELFHPQELFITPSES